MVLGFRIFTVFLGACLIYACTQKQPLMVNNPQIKGELAEIVRRTITVRNLLPKRPLNIEFISPEQLHEMIIEDQNTDRVSQENSVSRQDAMITMGLEFEKGSAKKAGTDLDLKFTVNTSAGIYSHLRKTLFIIDRSYRLLEQLQQGPIHYQSKWGRHITLSHETIHSLQHQHYPGLFEINAIWQHQDDVSFARRVAIEGDATYFSFKALAGRLPSPKEYFGYILESIGDSDSRLSKFPELYTERRIYPYSFGYRLAINEDKKLLETPPVSSEQVLHSDRRYESFWAIDLDYYRQYFLKRGCQLIYENSMGEFTLSLLFRSYDLSMNPNIWQGWDGDRYVSAQCKNNRQFIWLTFWDSQADAIEFENGYNRIRDLHRNRAGLTELPEIVHHSKAVLVFSLERSQAVSHYLDNARLKRVANRSDLYNHFTNKPDSSTWSVSE